ncbi:hypothetical protein SUGI_0447510 [Cryptomeria japonica]|nr:hypothetical protein SUGI_0447510 [Cryptomeria japonica]
MLRIILRNEHASIFRIDKLWADGGGWAFQAEAEAVHEEVDVHGLELFGSCWGSRTLVLRFVAKDCFVFVISAIYLSRIKSAKLLMAGLKPATIFVM